MNVLEVDLPAARQNGLRLRTATDPDGRPARISALAPEALAAVNGDFYVFDGPRVRGLGLEIRDGCLQQPPNDRSAFAVSDQGKPYIARFKLHTGLLTPGGADLVISGFGRSPRAHELILYDACAAVRGDSIRAEVGYLLQALSTALVINDTVPARVQQLRRQAWPLLLAPGQWVVAAGDRQLIDHRFAPGDTVGVYMQLQPEPEDSVEVVPYTAAIGGGPRIVRHGRVSVEYARESFSRLFAEERHPRTAVGHSHDGRWLYLLTVDGRQPGYSVGMTLAELASFMNSRLADFTESATNAYQAMNLDGGGSTTMVIDRQVVNSPSEQTGERPVANALVLLRPATRH